MGYEGKWAGGRTYEAHDGTRWIIRKTVDGRPYVITLDARSEAEALTELSRFMDDPAAYRTRSQRQQETEAGAQVEAAAAVYLDETRVEAFLAYLKKAGRVPVYVSDSRRYLALWAEDFAGMDLRKLDAKTTKKALGSRGARKMRTIALKSFCSWLVDEGHLDAAESPGRHLKVPTARRKHDTKGYDIPTVERLYRLLDSQMIRDVLCLRAKTGIHGTEIERIASGLGKLVEVDDHDEIAGTVTFLHKTGEQHRVSLDEQAWAAAKRLVAVGHVPNGALFGQQVAKIVKETGDAALKVDFGAVRHSFGTWLAERGELVTPSGKGLPVELIAQALGHKSTRTTKLHYLSVKVPPLFKVPIRLHHPDDPPLDTNRSDARGNVVSLRGGGRSRRGGARRE